MSTVESAALGRLRASSSRILRHLGGPPRRFRRVEAERDARRGTETWAPVTGSEVAAHARLFSKSRRRDDGLRETVEALSIEFAPFEAHGGLSDEWQILEGEDWLSIKNTVLSADLTEYETEVSRG